MKNPVKWIHQRLNPQRRHLLIVDDDEGVLKVFSMFFTMHHFQVTTATTLAEAETEFAPGRFDAVVLDVLLPDGDGLELLACIKKKEPNVPVIILTGLGYDEAILQSAMKNGASGYVSKLLPLDQLLAEIHRVLGMIKTGEPK